MKRSDIATCNLCHQSGELTVFQRNGSHIVRDSIPHLSSCPQYKTKTARHFKKKMWEKQERLANELVGASATEASGSRHKDGDGRRLFEWRVESKQTASNSYRMYWSIWNELIFKCKTAAELPLLHIQINGKKYCAVHPIWLSENCTIEQWDVGTGPDNKVFDFGIIEQKSFLLKENLFTKPNVEIHLYRNPNGEDMCIVTEYLFKELTKHV